MAHEVPTRAQVDALMKRCQRGVGGRNALDDAHSIMAECYGTLGALMLEVEQLRLAEEGAAEAFGVVVDDKRRLEAECESLRASLQWAHAIIRRQARPA